MSDSQADLTPDQWIAIAQTWATLSAGHRIASRSGNIQGVHSDEGKQARIFEERATRALKEAGWELRL